MFRHLSRRLIASLAALTVFMFGAWTGAAANASEEPLAGFPIRSIVELPGANPTSVAVSSDGRQVLIGQGQQVDLREVSKIGEAAAFVDVGGAIVAVLTSINNKYAYVVHVAPEPLDPNVSPVWLVSEIDLQSRSVSRLLMLPDSMSMFWDSFPTSASMSPDGAALALGLRLADSKNAVALIGISTANFRLLPTPPVASLAFDPSGATVYFTGAKQRNQSTVGRIAWNDGRLLGMQDLNGRSTSLALTSRSPKSTGVLIGYQNRREVDLVDASSLRVTRTSKIGTTATFLARPRSNRFILVLSPRNELVVLDARSLKVRGIGPSGGRMPVMMAIEPWGREGFIANYTSSTLGVVDLEPLSPGPVVGLAVKAGPNWLEVSWSAGESQSTGTATSYVVELNQGSIRCRTASTSCRLDGLEPGTKYSVRVVSENISGRSRPVQIAATTSVLKQPRPPSKNPQEVS